MNSGIISDGDQRSGGRANDGSDSLLGERQSGTSAAGSPVPPPALPPSLPLQLPGSGGGSPAAQQQVRIMPGAVIINEQQAAGSLFTQQQQQQLQQQQLQQQQLQQQQQYDPSVFAAAGGEPTAAGAPRQPLPKQLTAAIKSAGSVDRLEQLFNEHAPLLNSIHVAAMITKLPKLETCIGLAALPLIPASSGGSSGGGSSDAVSGGATAAPGGLLLSSGSGGVDGPSAALVTPWMPPTMSASRALLSKLLAKIKETGVGEFSARGLANIIWALAKLQHYPDPEMRELLLGSFVSLLPTAVPQDISNVLWGIAKLTKERSTSLALLVTTSPPPPAAAAAPLIGGAREGDTLPLTASGPLDPQQLPCTSSSEQQLQTTGSAGSRHSTPPPPGPAAAAAAAAAAAGPPPRAEELLSMPQVAQLLTHLCDNLHRTQVQTISNSLWAVVVLQHEHGWCLCGSMAQVQVLLHAFTQQPREALPGHIQPVIRCMVQLATACAHHNGEGWIAWQPPLLKTLLGHLFAQSGHMEQHHISSVLRDIAQLACLLMLLQRCSAEAAAAASGLPLGPPGAPAAGDMLRVLAQSTGPPDSMGTLLSLGMLRPQLAEMGLLPSVQHLCSMLTLMANHSQADLDRRVLAAAAMVGVALPSMSDASLALSRDAQAAGPTAFALLTMSAPVAAAAASGQLPPLLNLANGGGGSTLLSQRRSVGGGAGEESVFFRAGEEAAQALAATGGRIGPSPISLLQEPPLLSAPTGGSVGSEGSGTLPAPVEAAAVALRQQLSLSQPAAEVLSSVTSAASRSAMQRSMQSHQMSGSTEGIQLGDWPQQEAAAKQLTHLITNADSVWSLSEIFAANGPFMDIIHLTACITRLSKVMGSRPNPASESHAAAAQLLAQISRCLVPLLAGCSVRALANILWGCGRLRMMPDVRALACLLQHFITQLSDTTSRDCAVVLWSLARLWEAPNGGAMSPELVQVAGASLLAQLARFSNAGKTTSRGGASTSDAGAMAPACVFDLPGVRPAAVSDGGSAGSGPLVPMMPTPRDISNSLMALSRLGFKPSTAEDAAAATQSAAKVVAALTAAPGEGGTADSTAPAGSPSSNPSTLVRSPPPVEAAGAPGDSPSNYPQPRPPVKQRLLLPRPQLESLTSCLLLQAASAKPIDLQEAATALQNMGLDSLGMELIAAGVRCEVPLSQGGSADQSAAAMRASLGMAAGMPRAQRRSSSGYGSTGGGSRGGMLHAYGGPLHADPQQQYLLLQAQQQALLQPYQQQYVYTAAPPMQAPTAHAALPHAAQRFQTHLQHQQAYSVQPAAGQQGAMRYVQQLGYGEMDLGLGAAAPQLSQVQSAAAAGLQYHAVPSAAGIVPAAASVSGGYSLGSNMGALPPMGGAAVVSAALQPQQPGLGAVYGSSVVQQPAHLVLQGGGSMQYLQPDQLYGAATANVGASLHYQLGSSEGGTGGYLQHRSASGPLEAVYMQQHQQQQLVGGLQPPGVYSEHQVPAAAAYQQLQAQHAALMPQQLWQQQQLLLQQQLQGFAPSPPSGGLGPSDGSDATRPFYH